MSALLRGNLAQHLPNGCQQAVHGSGRRPAQAGFELGQEVFNGVKSGEYAGKYSSYEHLITTASMFARLVLIPVDGQTN